MIHIENVTVLKTRDECIQSAIAVINQASRYLRIRSFILDPDLFDNTEVNDALSAFARKSRFSEIHILLDYPDRLAQFDHSTLQLIRRLSQKIIVKTYFDEPNEDQETYILSDNRGVLIKYQGDDKEGFFSLTDAIFNRHQRDIFDYQWDRSEIAHHLRSFIL